MAYEMVVALSGKYLVPSLYCQRLALQRGNLNVAYVVFILIFSQLNRVTL